MRRRTLVVATVAATAGIGAAWWAQRGDPELEALWAQRFQRPEGGELVMASLRGRPLLINFWATWCAPCVKELPAIDRFHRENAKLGWGVAALAIDSLTPVREFLARVPVSMPVGLAGMAGTDLVRALGNAQGGLPFTVLVGSNKRIQWRKMGETTLEELRREAARVG